jgi:hypothetical protein
MKPSEDIKPGDVVQLSPDTCGNPAFAACMLVVTEVKQWGVQGYVQSLGENRLPGGLAYYRAGWTEFEWVGCAAWITR